MDARLVVAGTGNMGPEVRDWGKEEKMRKKTVFSCGRLPCLLQFHATALKVPGDMCGLSGCTLYGRVGLRFGNGGGAL